MMKSFAHCSEQTLPFATETDPVSVLKSNESKIRSPLGQRTESIAQGIGSGQEAKWGIGEFHAHPLSEAQGTQT
jgi:hypothetical protein